MITKIHDPKENSLKQSENRGSCVKLADYLSKEETTEKPFFSHQEDQVSLDDVICRIDSNKRTLKKNEDKFYMLSYNPSADEIRYIVRKVTGKEIQELSELNSKEKQEIFNIFSDYTRNCMEIYAKSFYREKELSADDLVYFGKVEEFRYYTYEDKEVKLGLRKKGEMKPGLNLHIHVIVSRMDASQTIRLSPFTSRGNVNVLNGKLVKNGFSIKQWHINCLEEFSNKYGYIFPQKQRKIENEHEHTKIAKVRNYLQNQVINQVMEGFGEEQKALSTIRKIRRITKSPKGFIAGYLKSQVINILLDKGQEL